MTRSVRSLGDGVLLGLRTNYRKRIARYRVNPSAINQILLLEQGDILEFWYFMHGSVPNYGRTMLLL